MRLQLRAAQRILDNIEEEYGGTLENADLAYFYQISCIVSNRNRQLERAKELGESLPHTMKSVGATVMLQRYGYYWKKLTLIVKKSKGMITLRTCVVLWTIY